MRCGVFYSGRYLRVSLVLLALVAQVSEARSATFAEPQTARTCKDARVLAGEVDGKLPPKDVVRYESWAVQACKSELGEDHGETLWAMGDLAITYGSTAEFMSRFFSKLVAGQTQSDALTNTKREFILHPKWQEPRYWAAFVLYGV